MLPDVRTLLDRAAGEPGDIPDFDALARRGLARRRRQRAAQVTSGLAVVVVVAVLGTQLLPDTGRPSVLLDSPPKHGAAVVDWPIAGRYELTRSEAGARGRTSVWEWVANGWDDWMAVTDGGDERLAVERYGPARRHGFADLRPPTLLDEPFAALNAALGVPFEAAPADEQPFEAAAPNEMLSRRFAREPEPGPAAVVTSDLPALREEVAARVGLAPDLLRSARVEWEHCDGQGRCQVQVHTSVWLPGPDVPLYAHELDPDGAETRLVATHVRFDLSAPTTTLDEPPPVASEWHPDPPAQDQLSWSFEGVRFSIEQGSSATFEVRNDTDAALQAPDALPLERYDGDVWVGIGEAPADLNDRATPLLPGDTRPLTFSLPRDAQPGSHRLRTNQDDRVLAQFWYAGDPNQP